MSRPNAADPADADRPDRHLFAMSMGCDDDVAASPAAPLESRSGAQALVPVDQCQPPVVAGASSVTGGAVSVAGADVSGAAGTWDCAQASAIRQ